MRRSVLLVCLLALPLAGCSSQAALRRQQMQSARDAQERAGEEFLKQQPAVFFRGDIRHPTVAWREGMTLAEALAEAQYTWSWDPRTISVTRHGALYPVNARRLLRGIDNPLLEPGDLVEVRH